MTLARPKSWQQKQVDALRLGLYLALSVMFLNGCAGHKTKGELISTGVDISSYAQARMRASGKRESTFSFPVLEIYRAGTLIYSGHESMENARVLKEFPASIQNLPPRSNSPRLREIVDAFPDFKAKERAIMEGKESVILSADLEDCDGCRLQEQALDEVGKKILQQPSVAILRIHVSHP